jgi:predicted DNA-binding protein (MmcQ/YjbR family)
MAHQVTQGEPGMSPTDLLQFMGNWPGFASSVKWQDDLVFTVAGKMFAVYCFQGKNCGQLSFKVDEERFLEYTDRPHVIPAPYMARAHWVSLLPAAQWSREEQQACLQRAFQLVMAKLPKKLQRELQMSGGLAQVVGTG